MKITEEILEKNFRDKKSTYSGHSGIIGIIAESKMRAIEIMETLLQEYSSKDIVRKISSGSTVAVELTTKDRLQWIPLNDSSRGYRLKGVIFDKNIEIDIDIFREKLLPMCVHCTRDTSEIFHAFS